MNILKWFGRKQELKTVSGGHNLIPPYLTSIHKQIFLHMDKGDGIDIFKKLWVVYKASVMIGDNVSSLPIIVKDKNGNKIDGDKINNKAVQSFLYKPNPLDSNSELIKQFVMFLVNNGNGYINVVDGINPDYWTLMSQHVTPIAGDTLVGEPIIKSYDYKPNDRIIHYPPEQIIHVKDFNPCDRIKGMSRISAGASEVGFAERMSNFKNNLYDNQAKPSGVLTTTSNLTDEQKKRLKEQSKGQYGGTGNAGNIMLLDNGLTWEQLSLSPADLDLIRSESMTESKLSTLMGVPPELLDIADKKQYANYKEARKGFYIETVLPVGKQVWAALNRYFFPDGNMRFVIDRSEIDVLRPEAVDLNTAWWITPNQKRAAQGLDKSDDPAMDLYYIPSNFIDINLLSGGGNESL